MKQNRPLVFIAIMLMLAIGNFFRIKGNDEIRPIQFLSVLAIGMLTGILVRELASAIKKKQQ